MIIDDLIERMAAVRAAYLDGCLTDHEHRMQLADLAMQLAEHVVKHPGKT